MLTKQATRNLLYAHAKTPAKPLTPEQIRQALGWHMIAQTRKVENGRR